MLAFMHMSKTNNTGDLFSAPYHYFEFGKHKVIDLRDLMRGRILGYDAAIFGGGAIAGNILTSGAHHNIDAKKRIAWGFGRTYRRQDPRDYSKQGVYPLDFDLIGIRDAIKPMPGGAEFIPCVSCMHEGFDGTYRISRRFAGLFNAKQPIPRLARLDMPIRDVMLNNKPIGDIIAHLASAKTVVTNSYHGAYWAALLGRGVIVLHPYSSKFYQMFWPVAYSFANTLKELKITEGSNSSTFLNLCRQANVAFYRKVLRVLND